MSDTEKIIVHSFESLAALDGPGLRYAVFLVGCPLRCAYCHNPDTWFNPSGTEYTPSELFRKIKRYTPYFGKDGGVTFSGGEPLLQARSLNPLVDMLQSENIHVALDTAGSVINDDVRALIERKPMLLLDIKMPTQALYDKYIGGRLSDTLYILKYADSAGCEIFIRYVIVPGINDTPEYARQIIDIASNYAGVKKITFLPYHTLGVSKYEKLGLDYSLKDVNPPSASHIDKLNSLIPDKYRS